MELPVSFDETNEVQFYYLESAFPFNAPDSIVQAAGYQFSKFITTHAGFGVFDVTTNQRFSIELVAQNYTGSLLPVVTATSFNWNNAGEVVVTNPFVPARWLISRLVSTTSGAAYNDLSKWLQERWNNPSQQFINPVTVLRKGEDQQLEEIFVQPSDSYTFVQQILQQLSNFGAPLDTFLSPSVSSFTYYGTTMPTILSWNSQQVPASVRLYYQALTACYNKARIQAGNGTGSDSAFLLALQTSCYKPGTHALVFRSASSVWNVTLAASPSTPSLLRATYPLPSTPVIPAKSLSAADVQFIIVLLVLIVCGLAGIAKQTLCVRKSRLQQEQERMAEETVSSILRQEDDPGFPHYASVSEHQLRDYFYPKKFRWDAYYPSNWSWEWLSWSGSATMSSFSSQPANDLSARESMTPQQLAQHYKQMAAPRNSQQGQRHRKSSLNPWDEGREDLPPHYSALTEEPPSDGI